MSDREKARQILASAKDLAQEESDRWKEENARREAEELKSQARIETENEKMYKRAFSGTGIPKIFEALRQEKGWGEITHGYNGKAAWIRMHIETYWFERGLHEGGGYNQDVYLGADVEISRLWRKRISILTVGGTLTRMEVGKDGSVEEILARLLKRWA